MTISITNTRRFITGLLVLTFASSTIEGCSDRNAGDPAVIKTTASPLVSADPDAAPPPPPPASTHVSTSPPSAAAPLLDAPDSEYIPLPGGRGKMHKSCVQLETVPSGSVVDGVTHDIQTPDGRKLERQPCRYVMHGEPQRDPLPIASAPFYEIASGADGNGVNGNPFAICGGAPFFPTCFPWFNSIYGMVQVPPAPGRYDGQYIYIWNGLVALGYGGPGSNGASGPAVPILQPVLSYGFGGSAYWAMVLWYIDSYSNPTALYAGAVNAFSYVHLNTYVYNNAGCTASSGNYCNWAMRVWVTGGLDVTYYFNNVPGIFNGAWRAVLETDGPSPPVNNFECPCYDLPVGNRAPFTNTFVYQPLSSATDYHQMTANWQEATASPKGYNCAYNWQNRTQTGIDLIWQH